MTKLLTVLPVIQRSTAERCINSIADPGNSSGLSHEEILVVDNSREGWGSEFGFRTYRDPAGHNIGVARAWNVGVREILDRGLDYLVILSASVEFGPVLHTTWKQQMETFWGENVIEAQGHSWHLIAFHRRVFEAVGLFDENFYPAYIEAIDFGYRMRLLDLEKDFKRVWVNAMSWGSGMHIHMASMPAAPLLRYYEEKWGGPKGEEKFTLPFGSKPLDWFPEKSIPELVKEYELEVWW